VKAVDITSASKVILMYIYYIIMSPDMT
jgi:hypothetical protein